MEFPSALLGVAIGTVLLPSLAQHHSDANHAEYSALLDWGLRLAFLLALPAAFALWLLAVPLITTLYQYGKFGVERRVADALGAARLQRRAARRSSWSRSWRRASTRASTCETPVKIAFVTVLVTLTLAVLLMQSARSRRPYAGDEHRRMRERRCCCSGSCAATVFTRPRAGWLAFLAKTRGRAGRSRRRALLAVAGPADVWLGCGLWEAWPGCGGDREAGAVAYFGALFLLGFRFADFNRREPPGTMRL